MRKILLGALFISATVSASVTPTGILLDRPWKEKLYAFSQSALKHPSWGLAHAERGLRRDPHLAKVENHYEHRLTAARRTGKIPCDGLFK